MPSRIFPTAQDAEAAFYEALGRSDLEAMMEVWAEDDEIVCVHPAGERCVGPAQVRASWAKMFASGVAMRVYLTQEVRISGTLVAVHSVHENFLVEGESQPRGPIVATNVYTRTSGGWRMIVHHGSPAPGRPEVPSAQDGPLILH